MITYAAIPSPLFGYKQMFEALELVDNAFATGYFKKHLEEIECAWVALDEEKVVGWASVCVERNEPAPNVGMLRCIVVHPDYRGKGIGKRLTEKRLKYLDKDCFLILSYAWIRPDGTCMSCKNLENFGFKLHKELNDYYNETRQACKYCGSGCKCTARQYIKINQR
jgi:N-acetylglutamate synthase-like GNAT family acetyltransferase